MFRLAHLSDIHLGPLPDVDYRDLASKRITGYVNWQRNRRRHMRDSIIDQIVADVKAEAPDHIAVTGDLVNLALDREIEMARLWLEMLGSPHDVSLVPGNHDAYVPGALDKACRAWGPWMEGDGAAPVADSHAFPYLRVRGDIALIGTSTARATAPFMANGYFRARQAARLGRILDEAARRRLFRVVMIHHPPVRSAAAAHKRLFGIALFQKVIRQHGAELVLHGHTHEPTLYWIPGRNGEVPVVGVAAAGEAFGSRRPLAQYNLIDIERNGDRWNVRLSRRGVTGPTMPVTEMMLETLSGEPAEKVALTA
ncbi:MAG: metallophosphoesterase [Rhizobiaceae bacterium]|nr:MAG: metallophosphoesterase [Rhizobiaceae bacterium]